MNRVQKKCLVASMGLHTLLGVILVVGPAFLASRQPNVDLPILEVIPDIITDARAYGGGNPNAKPPPATRVETPPPTPPPVQSSKPPEPVAKPAEVKPPPERAPERRPDQDAVEKKPDKPRIQVESKIVKRSNTKPAEKPTPPRNTEEDDAKDQARAAAEARRRTAQQILAKLNGASERLENLSSSTKVEPLGPGGAAFANYGQVVKSIYERNWIKPAQAEETAVVGTTVVVARNGRVVSAKIHRRSGNPAVDKSVQQDLDAVRSLPPFPEGSTDETRTFDIDFELRPNRSTG